MARTVYVSTELTGGGSGIDGINGNVMVAGDMAFYINRPTTRVAGHEKASFKVFMATTDAGAESSPNVIVPDANPGSWNWVALNAHRSIFQTTGKAATIPNYGVQIIRTTAPTVHVMRRPNKGAIKRLVFASTHAIMVRLTTAVAGSLATPTVTIGWLKSASSSCVIRNTSHTHPGAGAQILPNHIELAARSTSKWDIIDFGPGKGAFNFTSST